MTADARDFRDWLNEHHGIDYGASEDEMDAVLDVARAKRRALGYGSVYVMAANMIRDLAVGPAHEPHTEALDAQ